MVKKNQYHVFVADKAMPLTENNASVFEKEI